MIHPSNPEHYRMLFSEISEHCRLSVQSPARLQSIFYGLLSDLSYSYRREAIRSKQFHVIEKGILYLEEDKEQNLSIPDIAALCNVSEIYFRRLFKEYAGMSPVEYKLHTRLSRARQYLTSENFSIREVAELSVLKTRRISAGYLRKKPVLLLGNIVRRTLPPCQKVHSVRNIVCK